MSADEGQLEHLRAICPQASLHVEAGTPWVLMPKFKLATADVIVEMDLLLGPRGHSGYATRLLLEKEIGAKPNLNWQQVTVLGRNWFTWSWNNISPDQPWIKILAEHARLLR